MTPKDESCDIAHSLKSEAKMELLSANYTAEHRELADKLRSRLNIAGSLLDARAALGLSQDELGRLAGTKQSRVSEIEAMKGNPRLDTLDRIAGVIGLAIDLVPRRSERAIPSGYQQYGGVVKVEGTAESRKEATVNQGTGWAVKAKQVIYG